MKEFFRAAEEKVREAVAGWKTLLADCLGAAAPKPCEVPVRIDE